MTSIGEREVALFCDSPGLWRHDDYPLVQAAVLSRVMRCFGLFELTKIEPNLLPWYR